MNDGEPPVRFGTRGSALALVQTELAVARFRAAHPHRRVETRIISTEGDRDKTSPLTEIGGRGVFTNAIESAILRGLVDAAVHSAKDLPSVLHPGAPIVAFPQRDDPRDVLVSRHDTTLERLPRNPVIGTSSRRREAQIRRLRPDARIVSIRGNIDTRLRKAEGPALDGIILAAAGIHRMGWDDRISQYFPLAEMVPSPAQGAIAIQAEAASRASAELLAIDDPAVSIPVRIERAFLTAVGAGCTYPMGAFVALSESGFRLLAMLANDDGDRIELADELLVAGEERNHASEVAAQLRSRIASGSQQRAWHGWNARDGDLRGARVLVTRPRRRAGSLIVALSERGACPVFLPTIRIEPVADTTNLDAALRDASRGIFDWIVFTSVNAVEVLATRMEVLEIRPGHLAGVSTAAVGQATAEAVTAAGLKVTQIPESATADDLGRVLKKVIQPGARFLYPRSAIGRDSMPDVLRGAGMDVVTVDAYHTLPEPDVDPQALEQVRRGEIDLIAFASPSSVRNLIALLAGNGITLEPVPVVCAGPVTGQAARDAGLSVAAISEGPGATAMTEAIATYWRARGEADVAPDGDCQTRPAAVTRERSFG